MCRYLHQMYSRTRVSPMRRMCDAPMCLEFGSYFPPRLLSLQLHLAPWLARYWLEAVKYKAWCGVDLLSVL